MIAKGKERDADALSSSDTKSEVETMSVLEQICAELGIGVVVNQDGEYK